MNLGELIQECRRRTDDYAEPPLWSDAEWTANLNAAEREACVRARLLTSDSGAPSELTLEAGASRHPLSPLVIDVLSARRADDGRPFTGWTLDATHLETDRVYDVDVDLILTVHRRPLRPMKDLDDKPEIPEPMHENLVYWALHRAYLKADSETLNKGAAEENEVKFIRHFGYRPTEDVLRKQRRKTPRVVRSIQF